MSVLPSTVTVPHFVGDRAIRATSRAVPEPGPGQLLLGIRANALCGSERGQFVHGSAVTPGHEAAGVVVATGAGTATPLGTSGVVFLMDFCGACRSCLLGHTNQCLAKRGDFGFNRDGGYGPYALVSESAFFPVPDDIPPVEATLLLDVMGTGGHAIRRAQAVREDTGSVLITGAGPIGLGLAAMARLLLGPDTVVLISDIVPYRLRLAESLGARPILLSERSLADGLRFHGVAEPDVAIDAAGKGSVRAEALGLLGHRGALVLVAHGEGIATDNVSRDLISRERAVVASEYFAFRELPGNLELLRAHRAYLSPIVTHRYGVAEIQRAFDTFFAGDTGKVLVVQEAA